MKFVISGHRGLIGRRFKRILEEKGHECLFSVDLRDKDNPLDVRKINEINVGKNADVFFHLTSNCKVNKCISSPD